MEWVREEKSKIFHTNLEVMKVGKILGALNEIVVKMATIQCST